MTTVVVAEKPSVARDIARVLGAGSRAEGYLHGRGFAVTWALGHLVALAEPHQIDPRWKRWRRELLPMIPQQWPLQVVERTKDQFEVVRALLTAEETELVVAATDAGREGELIFRYIYDRAGCRKPVKRLWISSLTPEAIREGFRRLQEGQRFDALAAAARGRSRADWLVGMNLSRAYSLALDDVYSVGRVQTPTLALLVEREQAIRAFVAEPYIEVEASFCRPPAGEGQQPSAPYRGTHFAPDPGRPGKTTTRLPADGRQAGEVVRRAKSGRAVIDSDKRETRRRPPPLLYDLTELQRHANRLWGLSADRTLKLAQALYEKHKLISYPRTDCRHLSQDVAGTLGRVVQRIAGPYRQHLAPGSGQRPLGKRFVDDARLTDHHAIIPTAADPAGRQLSRDEARIHDLICRRLLSAWHQDHIAAVTTVITRIDQPDGEAAGGPDRYRSSGTSVEQQGWKVLDLEPARGQGKGRGRGAGKGKPPPEQQVLPPGLEQGQPVEVTGARQQKKETRPPRAYTEGTLLTAMETAGKALSDRELSDAMRERGLGTPATRAAIIETLLNRKYVERQGKALRATDKGIQLVGLVHEQVRSPAMTGDWERRLRLIERGEAELEPFLRDIEAYVRQVVARVGEGGAGTRGNGQARASEPAAARLPSPGQRPAAPPAAARQPTAPRPSAAGHPEPRGASGRPQAPPLTQVLEEVFGLERFRPHQQQVCQAVCRGEDALLVMPTGAGKSLCYQLPGVALGGTTLVISPLIALMEDQVAKLQQLGLRADRIHSGRDRLTSREVCRQYLDGRLQFLFIAPERLGVPGFPELLARRRPSLIAVDEAHCISVWGHDFRPDYRMLGQRLPGLRPAPVLALTATATPRVQKDITEQLGIPGARRYVHGFSRDNIAVEVATLPPSQRPALVRRLLGEPDRLPAIVYAPTRKATEALAQELDRDCSCAPYHAGMTAERRDETQARFMGGEHDAVVATIAFGMGIDKPDIRTVVHTALPGSLESYYQEIGRAGRDGLPSRAVLLYSWADRRTHEFFHERDYPEAPVLNRLFKLLSSEPLPLAELQQQLGYDEELMQTAADKLWVHRGLVLDDQGRAIRGDDGWLRSYGLQRRHRLEQLEQMVRFAELASCRMQQLVRHFGDRPQRPCGRCDVCAPDSGLANSSRAASAEEATAAGIVLAALRQQNRQASGRLHRQHLQQLMQRGAFEDLLAGMARAGLVTLEPDSFEAEEGHTIRFTRVCLTADGLDAEQHDGEALGRQLRLIAQPEAPPKKRRKRAAGGSPRSPRKRMDLKRVEAPAALVQALTEWRLAESRRRRVPAYRILTNRVLAGIAASNPATMEELLAVSGVGPTLLRRHGEQLLAILRDSR
jgi:DNA topoisomerase-3